MRIAIIGSTGQLGTDLVRVLQEAGGYEVIPLSHAEIECTKPDSIRTALTGSCPQVVVNCAAFVRVDECEDKPEEAFLVNALGALHVARSCVDLDALCVYISTDYVFNGKKEEPYTEEDKPCPINVYGTSKLAGEYLVSQACPKWLIVRMASLFGKAGARGKGGNFVDAILSKARAGESLRVVNDIRMSPTYSYDAAQVLERLIRQGATGIFHVTNSGSCTWYEFARKALDLVSIEARMEPIFLSEYPTRACRPKNSSLRSVELSENHLRSWEEALRAYLVEKAYTLSRARD
ncbi:MAG TPA: dTDP-4-dehydrorhamnose reductase [Thermodesulfobacteriota bacterium]|nr:dTDP-4-dehydrorhamnose reductase [Thermodesulfobacteriota bacterium]